MVEVPVIEEVLSEEPRVDCCNAGSAAVLTVNGDSVRVGFVGTKVTSLIPVFSVLLVEEEVPDDPSPEPPSPDPSEFEINP